MTTADILTQVNAAKAYEDLPYPVKTTLEKLAAELTAKIRQEAAASRGVGSAVTVISRMLKDAGKSREALGYTWKDKAGRQLMTDGFRAYRLNDPYPLPDKPDNITAPDISSLFESTQRRENVPLETTDRNALKAYVTVEKANGTRAPLWDFGPGLPAVNAAYLIDMLTVFPDAKLFLAKNDPKCVQPIYATSERGDGLLLPVRIAAKEAEAQLAAAANEAAKATEPSPAKPREKTVSLSAFARIAAAMPA
jgi:hypothetical protein